MSGGRTKVIRCATAREWIAGLLATTRYSPKAGAKKDKRGMPVVEPEPDDPDDE